MLRTIDRKSIETTSPELVRHVCDLFVCLVISVILVRSFQIEGYLISTGSMAPGLLGYHKQVLCPTCSQDFQVGLAFDDSVTTGSDGRVRAGEQLCTCPNCGQSEIDISFVPKNQGDQLLVNKGAFLYRNPDRFEPVVFRNPAQPSQAYVKRVAGLPGEEIQIRDGDVYIDGQLIRKRFARQPGFRIPVFDTAHQPNDRFEPDARWTAGKGWTQHGAGFDFDPIDKGPAWLTYTHVIRKGGQFESTVELTESAATAWKQFDAQMAEFPSVTTDQIRFDPADRTLTAVGVIGNPLRDVLRNVSQESDWQSALATLVRDSRVRPITDFYGYNNGRSEHAVRDLMLGVEVTRLDPGSAMIIRIQTGFQSYHVIVDAEKKQIKLMADDEILRSALFDGTGSEFLLEVSTFDRQVTVAVDGQPVFDPIFESAELIPADLSASPVQIGATGGRVRISRAILYRDVYYTKGRGRNGISAPYLLGSDEYFMLGDNSPVSSDSRSWPNGAVKGRLLVGKPFIVHLPSRPGKIGVGSRWRYIRMPDWSRVRFVE